MVLRSAAQSDIGRIRRHNEDRLISEPELGLYGVADGVGGLPGGAEAATLATERVISLFRKTPRTDLLVDIVVEANRNVAQLGTRLSPRMGIGTTLTFGHFEGSKLRVVHVGDSRCYLWHDQSLVRMTRDHSVENELKARGQLFELANLSEHSRGALTRCVGQYTPLEVDVTEHELHPGERVLFCSDGITKMIREAELARMLGEAPTPEAAVANLIREANQRGGLDNATAVVVFVE